MATEGFRLAGRLWNVTLAKELVHGRAPTEEVPVAPQYQAWLTDEPKRTPYGVEARPSGPRWVLVDEEKAMGLDTDLTEPLIAADLGDHFLVIDGWHRIYKAFHTGISTLPCRVLTPQETRKCEIRAR